MKSATKIKTMSPKEIENTNTEFSKLMDWSHIVLTCSRVQFSSNFNTLPQGHVRIPAPGLTDTSTDLKNMERDAMMRVTSNHSKHLKQLSFRF